MTNYGPTSELAPSARSAAAADPHAVAAAIGTLTLGWIDADQLRRECFLRALDGLHSRLTVHTYASLEDYLRAAGGDIELLICQVQGAEDADGEALRHVGAVCAAVSVPVIVLSDAAETQQAQAIRGVLRCGARGFIATRTTGLSMLLAALRFVAAGGTFAPLDSLLDGAPKGAAPVALPAPLASAIRFTGRQSAVLGLLRQGKANKIIAHELGMSESTVKVHVRNIMRTIGATNRTEVAYRLQDTQLGSSTAA